MEGYRKLSVTETCDILIIGAGAAGMGAAISAEKSGAKRICVIEREHTPGGVLNQCLHSGFGLGYFKEELTGREYAEKITQAFSCTGANLYTDTMVTEIHADRTASLSSYGSFRKIHFSHCILASGCRERTLNSLLCGGTRPAGIFTAGTIQKAMNLCHYTVSDPVIILGTGDIGQIVARDLIKNGKTVLCMIEQNAFPGGMLRNRRDCIEKYQIPVITGSTITSVFGDKRITGVEITNLKTGEKSVLECASLITALGLIPEQDLISPFLPKLPGWLTLAGNCSYVHDIVDSVSSEAEKIGETAAKRLLSST